MQRKKALIPFALLGLLTLQAPAAIAMEVDPQGGVSREAYGVRQCRNFGESWGRYVCYNTKRTGWISVAGVLPVPITRTTYKTHQVDCRLPHSKTSLRGKIAAEYCPQLPGLAPAPFLSL